MAWGSSGAGFATENKTAGTSWNVWSAVLAAAGDYLILCIATDNLTTTDGNTNDHTAVTTAASEVTWTKLYEFTNGRGSAAAGATVSLWLSTACPDTTVGSTTVDFSGSITAKACWMQQFQIGAGASISEVGTRQTLATDGADPASMTLGSLPSAEHLWVRGIALESNTDNAVTASSGWTALGGGASASTSGGGAAANMAAGGEFRIATATTQTSDPTWASGDNANILIALDEAAASTEVIPYLVTARRI